MYIPPAFKDTELSSIHATMRGARLANFVTCTANGLVCTPLPLFLDEREGEQGVIYGHLARANTQWKETPTCDALAIFNGPDAYVTPSWYESKKEHGKVVPTWTYVMVHAHGTLEAMATEAELLSHLTQLTNQNEEEREKPWAVSDAPEKYIQAMTRGIVGLRMKVERLEGSWKLNQHKSEGDRLSVLTGLSVEADADAKSVSALMRELENARAPAVGVSK